jgi:branched-subunit amino acid aminotransferase/4-amino-4-deoxychorismate lyase
MATELQLYAVNAEGVHALAVEAGTGTVHDLLERMPGGVYSALRTFEHDRFLWLEEHLARTQRSMAGLGWQRALDERRLRSALDAVVRAYPLADSRVRFDVLREPHEVQGVRADLFIALSPFVAVPETYLREGVTLDFAPHLQRLQPLIKTTDFVRERKPLPLGAQGRYEHVMVDARDRVLECSSSNLAFFRGDELVTAGDGVLEGITLMVLLHIAPRLGFRLRRERLPLAELARVDECFLSSSARGVVPVVQVGEQRIADGRVGERVRRLTTAYYEFAARESRRAI